MTLIRMLTFATILTLGACSASGPDGRSAVSDTDKEKLIDVLTLFVESVQGDRFEKAMGFLTQEEKGKMTDASGQVPPAVQKQLKALRLSTLAAKQGVALEKGKLAGIHPWLPNLEHSAQGAGGLDSLPPLFH